MSRMRASIALPVLLLLCGCNTANSGRGGAGDGVAAIQFQDMAVPEGLKLHDSMHESYSSEKSNWRFGHFEYSGQPKLEDACAHVLQRMPQHAWSLVSDQQPDKNTRVLKFSRGNYTTEYTLRSQDGITNLVIDYRTEIQSR